jgi:hypothetical protein
MRRIKKGLEATGLNIEAQFTGLDRIIEVYLMAERERCAKIAQHAADWSEVGDSTTAYAIAKKIRSGRP